MTDWFAVTETTCRWAPGSISRCRARPAAWVRPWSTPSRTASVDEADLDAAVGRLLGGLDRIGALDGPAPAPDPKAPTPADVALLRRAAAESTVLLSNDGVLPLARLAPRGSPCSVPTPLTPTIMGGGSAQVTPHRVATVVRRAGAMRCGPDIEVVVRARVRGLAVPGRRRRRGPPGARRLRAETLRRPRARAVRSTETQQLDAAPDDGDRLELRARRPATGPCGSPGPWSRRRAGVFQLALAQAGRARLLVNDEVVLDGFANRPLPAATTSSGRPARTSSPTSSSRRACPSTFVVEYAFSDTTLAGFRVGFRTPDADALLERAVAAAAAADVAIVCVGTSEETETEGRDRTALALPGRQDELIRRVAAVNDRTVVVVNAAAPVDMAWAGRRRRRAPVLVRRAGDGRRAGGRARRHGGARGASAHHHPDTTGARARRTRTSRARTASCATARASSWGTAATSTTRSRPGSRSATA